jgi:hypothetical protein
MADTGSESSADPYMAAWTPRIHLAEERPPQPDDFSDSAKEQSLDALRTLANSTCNTNQLPSAVILLCEHIPLPLASQKLLPLLPLDDSAVDLLWSTPEHRHLAEKALQRLLTDGEATSLTKLLGKACKTGKPFYITVL